MDNLYSVLGVSPEASNAAIKAAYYSLAKQYHPDTHAGAKADRRIREINQAYQILSDEVGRAAYDLMLERQRAIAQTRLWRGVAVAAVAFALTFGSVPLLVIWRQAQTPQETTDPARVAAIAQAEGSSTATAAAAVPRAGEAFKRTPAVSSSTPPAGEVAESGPRVWREPVQALVHGLHMQRSHDAGPTLALSNEAHDESRAFGAPPQPSAVPPSLTPGTERTLTQSSTYERLVKWRRAVATMRRDSHVVRAATGSARNYQELRKYVLSN